MITAELIHRLHQDRELPRPQVAAPAAIRTAELIDDNLPESTGLLGLVELILKRRDRLESLIRQTAIQPQLLPRLLAISLVSFVFFGICLSLVFSASGEWPHLAPLKEIASSETSWFVNFERLAVNESSVARWLDGSAMRLIGAYAIGLIAATGICLPSLYFYGLLAGVRMTMLDVVLHALKSKATAAVVLIGILPIYATVSLGIVIFDVPEELRHAIFWLGMTLPFIAGFFGTYSLYQGFAGLTDTLEPERRYRRECFLRRLVLSWSVCYTAVTPVMIHTLWTAWST